MFEVPSGYDCVVRNSDTSLYGYNGNTRTSFIPNGFSWQATSISTTSNRPSASLCVTSPQFPASFSSSLLIGGLVSAVCFFVMIYKIFKRVLFP